MNNIDSILAVLMTLDIVSQKEKDLICKILTYKNAFKLIGMPTTELRMSLGVEDTDSGFRFFEFKPSTECPDNDPRGAADCTVDHSICNNFEKLLERILTVYKRSFNVNMLMHVANNA